MLSLQVLVRYCLITNFFAERRYVQSRCSKFVCKDNMELPLINDYVMLLWRFGQSGGSSKG